MADPAGDCALTWIGHATVAIELDGVRLLTDPALRGRIGPLVRIAGRSPPAEPGADYVLLSHLHADHTDLPSLRLVGAPAILAPAGSAEWLRRKGFSGVYELRPGDVREADGLRISATPAVHDGRRQPLGPAATPVGYVVQGSRSVYFAGDTDLFPEMAELRGLVDVALLPVSGWGPRLGPGHLDPERAARAAAIIAPRLAIPIHWGTFALGWGPRPPADVSRPAREFASLAESYAPDVEVRLLAPGERTGL